MSVEQKLPPAKNIEDSGLSGAGWLVNRWLHLWNECMRQLRLASPTRSVRQEVRSQQQRWVDRNSNNSNREYRDPNLEQRQIADVVMDRQKRPSVFITGAAGTGKSFLVQFLIQELTKQGVRVAITASTGAAADIIGGSNLWSKVINQTNIGQMLGQYSVQ